MCGENGSGLIKQLQRPGSPPRVRGKQHFTPEAWRQVGITPACAGKTIFRRKARNAGGDHPRVCGENESRREIKKATEGSPPRVRGKREVLLGKAIVGGITPACAGKTAEY